MLYAKKLVKKPAKSFAGVYHVFVNRPKGWEIVPVYTDQEFTVKGVGTFQGGGVLKTDFKAAISDLKVYQRGEVATVFIFWPEQAAKTITATVNHGSSKLREVELALDANGAGTFRQDDLQLGEYTVVTKDWGLRTTFTVAEYTQSPLVAALSDVELVNNVVRGMLTLSTFGTKLAAGTTVVVELKPECAYYYFQQENLPQTKEFVVGEDGKVKIEFQLPKYFYGGLGLVVTDKQRASLTAEVAIPMAQSAYQMQPSPFNTMGEGALLVSPMATPGSFTQRGLHFTQGPTSSDPIEPVAPISETIQLMVHQPCKVLVVGVFNPTTGAAKEHRYQNVAAGSVITLPYEGIWARVAVAAWVKSERSSEVRPFEGVTNFMKPERVAVKICAPKRVAPGGKLNFSVEATGAQQGSVIIVVKSTALQSNGKPEEELAEQMLEGFKSTGANAGYVTRTPEDAHYFGYGWCGTSTLESAMLGVPRAMAAPMAKGGLESTSAEADQPEEPAREEQQITTLYAALHTLENGKVVVQLDTPLAMADVTISAFLVTAGDWAAAEPQQVLIVTDLFTKLSPPAHVAPGDMVIMTALTHSATGKATAHVCADGQLIPFTVNGKLIQPGEAFATPAVLSFAVRGGELVEVMTENEFGFDRVEAFIPVLGDYLYDHLKLIVALEGESLTVSMFGLKRIEVMPGMAGIFAAIAKAVSQKKVLPYDCCGQTAAKLAVMVQAIVDGNKDMRWPLFDGVDQMNKMHVPYKGFRFYVGSNDVASSDNHYAISAALDLRSLQMWIKHPAIVGDPEVFRAVKSLIAMGEDACKVYGLTKGRKIFNMQEAFVALALHGKNKEAENFVRSKLVVKNGAVTLAKNEWGWLRQSDLAYAAVICLRLGMTREGYQLANAVFGTFDRYCMPYGYLELLPVCLMLSELNKLDAESLLIVNGKEMTTQQLFKFTEPITSLVVVKGAAFVRTTTIVQEDIHSRDVNVHLTAELVNPTGEVIRVGDQPKLRVIVDKKLWGDVVAIMLPNSLAFLKGGAQVRTTEKDLKWWSKMEYDLVAVTDTRKSVEPGAEAGQQTIYVLVRNMDDRTRLGLLAVKVKILPLV